MTTPKDRPDMGPIEVITSVQRRRRWSPEEKRSILEEAEQPGNSLSAVARKYGVNPNQLFHWRKLMREGALIAVGADDQVVPASEVKQLKAQIRELERLLGKKTMCQREPNNHPVWELNLHPPSYSRRESDGT